MSIADFGLWIYRISIFVASPDGLLSETETEEVKGPASNSNDCFFDIGCKLPKYLSEGKVKNRNRGLKSGTRLVVYDKEVNRELYSTDTKISFFIQSCISHC